MMMNCRRLTGDVKHLRPGDEVYVDFAGFVWPKKLIDDEGGLFTKMMMGMRRGIFRGGRKFLRLIPSGTVVELTQG